MQWVLSITCSELSACSQQMQPDTQNVSCNMHNGTLSRQTACENAVNIIARFTLNTILKTVLPLTQTNWLWEHWDYFILQDSPWTPSWRQFFFWFKTNWLWEHWDYFILQHSSWTSSWRYSSSSDSRQTGCENTGVISSCKIHLEDTVLLTQDKLVVRKLRLFHIASFIILKTHSSSLDKCLVRNPPVCPKPYGQCSFSYWGPSAWSQLLLTIRHFHFFQPFKFSLQSFPHYLVI